MPYSSAAPAHRNMATTMLNTISLLSNSQASFQTWRIFLFSGVIVSYLLLVRLLRHRRRDALERQLRFRDTASFAKMTVEEAHSIQLPLAEQEFPTAFSISIFFALFKTYGIPSISKLLVTTGQLSSTATASKRAADTGVILTEVILNKIDSSRTMDGIARMNYLHDRYRKANKISDNDMLYTLSLFSLEPIRWTRKYEWRSLTDIERCAMGVYWKDLGEVMEIPYGALNSSKLGWRDGLHWLEELEEWSLAYEKEHMVPAAVNAKLASSTLDIALFNVPFKLRGVGRKLAATLLESRLRRAMVLDDPPASYDKFLRIAVTIRKFLLRHFFLPRPYFWRAKWFSEKPDLRSGCFHSLRYISHPWYIKPTVSLRWRLTSWVLWLVGGVIPGDEGCKYRPGGYCIAKVGPDALEDKGHEEMKKTRETLCTRRQAR